jgi:hypothetical protein
MFAVLKQKQITVIFTSFPKSNKLTIINFLKLQITITNAVSKRYISEDNFQCASVSERHMKHKQFR